MGDRHDYVALEWVKGEIAETLKQARHALEEYVDNPEDSTRLRFCLTYVHQVHGTLQMVEFFGAALLAEEMEQLAQALLEDRVSNLAEALEVLMQAILQLPLYLDRIQTARHDLPMVVLPLLNDLRAARGEKLLSETSLFTPTLPAAHAPLSAQRMQQLSVPEMPVLLKKLRQMLQVALVGVFRGQGIPTNLEYMARVFARLEILSQGAPLEPLWRVAAGLVDGLANGSVEAGASVRTLLRQVDAELRRLVIEQAQGLNQPAPAELIKNLLFYVAKAQPDSPRLEKLHTQYRLAEALPDELLLDEERAHMSGPDRGAIRSVVAALCEELVRIKDSLDLFVRSDHENLDELGALQAPLKQIADTLAVLGFAQPRKVVLDQIDVVTALSAGDKEVNDAVLMDIAGALLYIEATLAGMVGNPDDFISEQNLLPTTDVGQIHRLVIKEARTGLEHAKDGIIEFIASQWNHDNLANVPHLLNQVRGGLAMIPLPRAAALVETCRRYIEEQLFENKVIPNWQSLDTLADAITSVEYYLERLAEDHASQGESILDVAEESLTSLGYAPAPVEDVVEDSSEHDALGTQRIDDEEQLADADVLTPEPGLEHELNSDHHAEVDQSAFEAEDIPTLDVEWDASSSTETDTLTADASAAADDSDVVPHLPEQADSSAPEFDLDSLDVAPEFASGQSPAERPDIHELEQAVMPEMSLEDVMSSTLASVNPPATDVPPSILPPAADEEPIDEELQDVFVEEAEEVLATLNEFFPQWRANQDDKDALTEVRRAFHTLKGSGRMVRALVAGELAWSIENMLNRVIEGSLQVSEPVFTVIADVIQLFPELVAEYAAQQQRQRDDVDQLAATAHALARNEPAPVFASTADAAQAIEQEIEQEIAEGTEIAELGDALVAVEDISVQSQPEASVDEEAELIDPVLLEIFKVEAQAHVQTLVEFLADCAQQLPKSISDDLQRAMHTLKGSAFMAGIVPIANIATALEKLAKDYKANLLPVEFNEALLLSEAEQLLGVGIEQLDSTPLQAIEGASAFIDKLNQLVSERLAHADEINVDDPKVISTFLSEGMDTLLDMDEQLECWRMHPAERKELAALLEELRALGRSAEMAELPQIEELCAALLETYTAVKDGRLPTQERFFEHAKQAHDALINMMDQVAAGLQVESGQNSVDALYALMSDALSAPVLQETISVSEPSEELELTELSVEPEPVTASPVVAESVEDDAGVPVEGIAETDELVDAAVPPLKPVEPAVGSLHTSETDTAADLRDPELVEIFLEEGFEIIDSATAALLRWIANSDNVLELETLLRELHTLKGGARMAEIPEIGDLAHELEFLYEDLSAGRLQADTSVFNLLQDCHDSLAVMLEAVRDHTVLPDGRACIGRIQQLRGTPLGQQPIAESIELQTVSDSVEAEDTDDILSIFMTEADELLAELDTALELCTAANASEQPVDDALRALHTLKGGAQLADAQAISDTSQQIERQLLEAVQQKQPWPDHLQRELRSSFEKLTAEVAALRQTLSEPELARQPSQAEAVSSQPPQWAKPIVAVSTKTDKPVAHKTLPFVEKAKQAAARASAQRAPQEQVRVPAELLEDLVNLAGETSIFRGRVEQQVSDFGFTLNEMEATIDRVRDQLRRLDTETQAQILSRYQAETEKAGYEDFDPLEMDRYSQLQQLSRALFESSSDLLDLKETLAARSRDAETLLLQQARVNTELQEGLMRTRMVPFERLLPRLRRVVRQISNELGKDVDFIVTNAEGEVDRSVLERMLAPLEHMLRNAIGHGIESAEARRAAGKPEQGTIRLELSREGADILLVLSDDGAGVNLAAVRNKAIERGLITADTVLTDQEMTQFILHAGFSTATNVTQISGRGVGMDVVSSEIKQIGGSITIDSQQGIGTRFNIRLPFTVSVNRALMVMAGEDSYAIPLNTIEGIVRVSPFELEALYQQEQQEGQPARFEYAGQEYQLKYIGDLLNNGQNPKLVGQTLPLPVILVRSNEYAVAVQVDVLAGSREIVVKSLGPQFASVHGISGATILGDGRVVVILDLMATIRMRQSSASLTDAIVQPGLPAAADKQAAKLVMIVDDSVTVRKVTSRLLERYGMQVMVAKDGVDAITQLQERRPDIMLLDIEMPRMDGFEVANLVRHDSTLKDLPIIMITSRTGEKHRERAMAIGVNDYLGKPYQETVLLEAISKLIDRHD
ncbi:response regulator [Pseudomonas sp. C27(2019)]|uniref:Hpt domain-containing protein n=1 Tax=Pseudomonas sp. C27(2019) TaxID=2604941 RepID=UPI001244CDDE|nr:Hpt domain-containing protein [Pseudomonas sp. C27(2019)]QEY60472.1 response regulator [Pseudomonas sp. C27(2019)]